ncbi:MAG TPA: S-methyl-5-thioribose-1-phosphate isomerase [Desulfatiglandales bacterium]|nr:S-methyl-5-thioribose-1-phosphate isomerase [Desulfatiglandales bacterium]
MIPTIKWKNNCVYIIDQRKLPNKKDWLVCHSLDDIIAAIKEMAIRGAPAIGVAAAMGLAMGSCSIETNEYETFVKKFSEMADRMKSSRPTAVNLQWAVDRIANLVKKMSESNIEKIKGAIKRESQIILDRDVEANIKMGQNGLSLIPERATILTHCNAGALATGGYGTALGMVRAAHAAGKNIHVIADETRPLLQGLRLTAFELMEENIPFTIIVDSAAGYLMRKKRIDLVVIGADRIALNGDVANKIGSYQLAVLAKENKIPFYVAAPISSFDPALQNGDLIPVEERDPKEVISFAGKPVGPKGAIAFNPSFDITPAGYISAIITDKGILRPPYKSKIRNLLKKKEEIPE